jgi:hypothetical protein
MKCGRCQEQTPSEANYCQKCGASLLSDREPAPVWKLIQGRLFVVCLVVIAIGIVIVIFGLSAVSDHTSVERVGTGAIHAVVGLVSYVLGHHAGQHFKL